MQLPTQESADQTPRVCVIDGKHMLVIGEFGEPGCLVMSKARCEKEIAVWDRQATVALPEAQRTLQTPEGTAMLLARNIEHIDKQIRNAAAKRDQFKVFVGQLD